MKAIIYLCSVIMIALTLYATIKENIYLGMLTILMLFIILYILKGMEDENEI